MTITSIEGFLSYYGKTREVTNRLLAVIPPGKVDWSYKAGKFSIGDLVRHIAAIERHVFAEVASGNRPNYQGCGKALADGYPDIMAYFNEMHRQSMGIFARLQDESLKDKIKSLAGNEIELAAFLRALIIHEVHHRAALCIYLNLLGVSTPPIIGLTEEEVIQLSKNQA